MPNSLERHCSHPMQSSHLCLSNHEPLGRMAVAYDASDELPWERPCKEVGGGVGYPSCVSQK